MLEVMNGRIDHFQVLWLVILPFEGDEWTYRLFQVLFFVNLLEEMNGHVDYFHVL